MSTIVKLLIGFVLGFLGEELPPDAQPISETEKIICMEDLAHHQSYLICTKKQNFISKNEHYVLNIKSH